jgi:hypothetical protein
MKNEREIDHLISRFEEVDYYRNYSLEEKVDLLMDGIELLLKQAAEEKLDD